MPIKKLGVLCVSLTLLCAGAIIILGMGPGITGREMLYSLLGFYVAFPLVAFVCGCILGWKIPLPHKWLYIPLCGMVSYLMPLMVFGASGFLFFLLGVLPSAAGTIGATLGQRMHHQKNGD